MKHALGRTLAAVAISLFLLGPGAEDARAQADVGVQLSVGTESDLGVGARVGLGLEDVDLRFVGEGVLFFPDGPQDWVDLNANLFYDIPVEDARVLPYVGGGLNIAIISIDDTPPGEDDSFTEVGVNLGGGVEFPTESNLTPFLEGRVVISDADQVVFTAGLKVGGPR